MKRKHNSRKNSVDSNDTKLARYIIFAAVMINFILLIPLFDGWCLVSGDGTSHYVAAQQLKFNMESGEGLFSNWNPAGVMGFPAYTYYQYFAHLFLVILHFLSFKLIPILLLEKLLIILAVALFPVSLYYGLRKLTLPALPAAFASLLSFTLASSVGHGGLGFSLVHHGVFTQLMGVFLFPIVLARIYITLNENRSYFLSVLLLAILMLTHPIVGYCACIISLIFLFRKDALSSKREFFAGAGRLALILALVFVVVSHFFIPLLTRPGHYGEATWVTSTADYYQSSMPQVIFDFFTGRTLDFFRTPFMLITVFFFIGLYAAVSGKSKDFPMFIALTGFLAFLLISFGRSFWGVLFDLVPGMNYVLVFRMMFALQFFALFFVGAGFAFLFDALRSNRAVRRATGSPKVLLVLFLVILTLPVFAQVFMTNQKLCRMTNEGFDEDNFNKVVLFLRNAPDGRFISRPELGFTSPLYEALLPVYTSHDSFSSSSIGSVDSVLFFYTQYFMVPSHAFYDLFNVRYVLMPSGMEPPFSFQQDTFVAGNYTVYSIETTGLFDLVDTKTALVYDTALNSDFVRSVNRAWLNTNAMQNKEFIAMFPWDEHIADDEYAWVIDERTNSLSEDDIKRRFKDNSVPPIPACGNVVHEDRGLDRFTATVLTNRSCLVLFKMSHNPSWHALVGGEEQDIIAVSPSFMAVPVEAGLTGVEFYYQDDLTLRYWLIACAVFVLFGLLLYDFGSPSRAGKY